MDINPQLNNVNLTALSLIQQYFKTEAKRPIQIFREKIKIFFTGSKKTSDETMLQIIQEERFNAVPFLRDVLEIFLTQENMGQLLLLQETIQQHDDMVLYTSKIAYQDLMSKYGYSTHLEIEEASKLFHRLYQACFSFISLVEEGDTSFAYEAAYKLMILFDIQAQTAEQAFEELCPKIHKLLQSSKKTHNDKLLHDLILVQLQELPHGSLIKDLKNWQSFIYKYQAEALSYFVVAESIEQVSGKAPTTLEKAKEIKARLVYKRSGEDPEFAELCLKYSVHESTFDHGLAYLEQGWPRKLSDEIPNITVTEKGYVWSKLPVDDKRALILGKITDCCQSIGGHSENCVMDGVSQPYNGFYILTHGKKIVGQAYVWISSAGNLSIDSIECLKNSISIPVLESILNEFARQVLEQSSSINRITLGKGGKTPKNITYRSLLISEIISDGQSYFDSKYQYCIAQRSLPLSQLSHYLVNYNDEFKECIFYIYEKVMDKEHFPDFLADLLVRYPTLAQRLNLKTFSCLIVDDSVSHYHIEKFAQNTASPLTDEEIILLSLKEVPLNKRKVLLKICVGNNLKFNDE